MSRLGLKRRWVIAGLIALTIGAGTFASANYLSVSSNTIYAGTATPRSDAAAECQAFVTTSVAFSPDAQADPVLGMANGAFVVETVHVDTTPVPTLKNPACAGKNVDVALNGSGAPYPLDLGAKVLDANGTADWTLPPAILAPVSTYTVPSVAIY